ncbi:uncharacterized protein F4822DRAFT_406493 [Hypoxylon trugodes]|uniref:uncharacterized protein n=1 Tax=Hypoxylon trugodes TaxID=326681 RepID=UPI00218EE150|nr:uncharacterized protein F4822DRAFT_406493 [Hypoxylon trugodes]KAI1387443.1 hypothetical protein F4822DRAFT_406493 [Hypoxylon trugodes]
MGGFDNNKSSELGRGSSLRASVRFSNVPADDDDYDLQAMGIADGFRPVEVQHNDPSRPSSTQQDVPISQIPPPRPSSITKPHRREESLSLQHDGSSTEPDSDRTPSRVSTVSTASPFVDPEDSYEGPSGPSHPYQMYPQDVRVARTASLATTSTAPISERSYNGPRGPAHPYSIYPQNTIPEADGMRNRTAQGEINVGFPGTTDNYQRRIGPDGEDVADLIGPDGHTEQLPPYTRYPEETYNRKALGIETPQPAPVQPMLAIPGAGGIGVATRNPEFASTEDLGNLNSPQSRQSVRSFTSDGSQRELTAATRPDKEEVTDEKRLSKDWQTTAKRRVWGIIPCWAIILASIVLVLMGVILGAVIGTLANPHVKKPQPPDRPPSPVISPGNWDTQPLSTLPPDLPPLPEGNFSMFLGRNNRISNTCFSDPTLAQAWSCDLTFSQLAMSIKKLTGQPNISDYSFGFLYNDSSSLKNNVYSYGVQPPDITDMKLKLVSDVNEASRGPAWNFEVGYNKTVIVPEPFISAGSASPSSSQKRRRMLFGGDFKRKQAQIGEQPWICHWDNTIMEAFIYAGQNNSYSHPMDPGQITNAPTASGSNGGGGPAPTPTPGAADAGNGGEFGGPSQGPHGDPQDFHTSASASDGAATATSASPPAPSFDKGLPMPFSPAPIYPRVVKVEERRNSASTSTKPWCRKVRIVGDNQEAVPVLDANQNPIEIYINENEGGDDDDSGESKRNDFDHYLGIRNSAKGTDMSECGCIWWLS